MPRIDVDVSQEVYTGLIDEGQYVLAFENVSIVPVKSSMSGPDPRNQLMWEFKTVWNNKEISLIRFTPLSGRGVGFTRDILNALAVPCEDGTDSVSFDTD